MTTYTETRGRQPFNWRHELQLKIKNSEAGLPREEIIERSKKWVTCATGNLCAIFPRNQHGRPRDIELNFLGMDFYDFIKIRDYESALITLNEIEERSSYLLFNVYGGIQPLAATPILLI